MAYSKRFIVNINKNIYNIIISDNVYFKTSKDVLCFTFNKEIIEKFINKIESTVGDDSLYCHDMFGRLVFYKDFMLGKANFALKCSDATPRLTKDEILFLFNYILHLVKRYE